MPNTTKMNTKTIYQSNFHNQVLKRTESGKRNDQLKSGLPWTGSSTYRELFNSPSSSKSKDIKIDK